MPYGIKNETPEITAKMERCVKKVMAKPDFKPQRGRTREEAAIAICKSTIAVSNQLRK